MQDEKNLWASVLFRAIDDAGGRIRDLSSCQQHVRNNIKEEARSWFISGLGHVGSFKWICNVLDLDSDVVYERLKNNDFLNNIPRIIYKYELTPEEYRLRRNYIEYKRQRRKRSVINIYS